MQLLSASRNSHRQWLVHVFLLGVLLAPRALALQERVEGASQLRFEVGAAVLTSESNVALDGIAQSIAARIAKGEIARVRVEGHTDADGDPDANLRLSEGRARAIADALLARGLSKEAVESIGYGELRPVADNSTPAGREQNRRVELRLFSKEEGAQKTVALVAATLNDVGTKQPRVDDWTKSFVNEPLFEAWRVAARERSAADIAFERAQSRVHVRENTVVVIFGKEEAIDTSAFRVSLEKGSLLSRLAGLSRDAAVEVRTKAAIAEVDGADVLVMTDDKGHSRIGNHKGKSTRVRSARVQASPVDVAEGYGTLVVPGRLPTTPQRLPAAPASINKASPEFTAGSNGKGNVKLTWSEVPNAQSYRINWRKADGTLLESVLVPSSVTSFTAENVPVGHYAFDVAVVDVAQFEGQPSSPVAIEMRGAPVAAAPLPPPPASTAATSAPAGGAADAPAPVAAPALSTTKPHATVEPTLAWWWTLPPAAIAVVGLGTAVTLGFVPGLTGAERPVEIGWATAAAGVSAVAAGVAGALLLEVMREPAPAPPAPEKPAAARRAP